MTSPTHTDREAETPMTTDQQREAVARIIDPDAWADFDRVKAECPEYLPTYSGQGLIDRSLRTADRILSHLAPQVEGWRPIESAPKDGTEVLAWGVTALNGQRYAPGREVAWWNADEGEWDTRDPCIDFSPTHWQSLPEPPALLSSAPPPLVGGSCSASAEEQVDGARSPPSTAPSQAGGRG